LQNFTFYKATAFSKKTVEMLLDKWLSKMEVKFFDIQQALTILNLT